MLFWQFGTYFLGWFFGVHLEAAKNKTIFRKTSVLSIAKIDSGSLGKVFWKLLDSFGLVLMEGDLGETFLQEQAVYRIHYRQKRLS